MRKCRFGDVAAVGLLTLVGGFIAGCEGLPYVLHLVEGQLQINGDVEPIDKVLASDRLSADDKSNLELAVQARRFAADVMRLNVGDSYTTYYDSTNGTTAWNLSAARRDALVAKTWTFPLVGEVPYLAFFDEGYLHTVEKQLVDDGYDTLTYELDAYSTLGLFKDPVRSTMLERGSLSLVETIIHELLHNTVWRANNTVFNESLATFVGRQGAVDFLVAEYGVDSGWPDAARAFYADQDAVNAFLMQLYDDLATFYAQPISREEKIDGREAVYEAARQRFVQEVLPTLNYPDAYAGYRDLPSNNAWMLANYRYNLDLDLMARVHAATGEDWPATIAVFQKAADASGDPFQYLRDWLAGRGG